MERVRSVVEQGRCAAVVLWSGRVLALWRCGGGALWYFGVVGEVYSG